MKRLAVLLAVLMLLAVFAGCGSEKTVKTEDGTVKVDEEKAQVEVQNDDGSSTEINVAAEENVSVDLPEGYPEDLVPIFEGAVVTAASRNQDADNTVSYGITLSTDKDPQEVYEFYKETGAGGTELNTVQFDGTYSISFVKEEQQCYITITPQDTDGSKITNIAIGIEPY